MIRRDRTRERLIALFMLGLMLMVPPVLLIFDRPVRVLGIPLLYLYLFAAWTAIIGLGALVASKIDPFDGEGATGPAPRNGGAAGREGVGDA